MKRHGVSVLVHRGIESGELTARTGGHAPRELCRARPMGWMHRRRSLGSRTVSSLYGDVEMEGGTEGQTIARLEAGEEPAGNPWQRGKEERARLPPAIVRGNPSLAHRANRIYIYMSDFFFANACVQLKIRKAETVFARHRVANEILFFSSVRSKERFFVMKTKISVRCKDIPSNFRMGSLSR